MFVPNGSYLTYYDRILQREIGDLRLTHLLEKPRKLRPIPGGLVDRLTLVARQCAAVLCETLLCSLPETP